MAINLSKACEEADAYLALQATPCPHPCPSPANVSTIPGDAGDVVMFDCKGACRWRRSQDKGIIEAALALQIAKAKATYE